MRRSYLFFVLTIAACTPRQNDASPAPSTASSTAAPPTTKQSTPAASASVAPAASAAKPSATCQPPVASAKQAASADGKVKVFVETDPSGTDSTGAGDLPHERLCIAKDGAPARVLLEGTRSPDVSPENTLAGFDNFLFAPDNKTLYFTSEAWATSSAAHAVDLATGKQRFLVDGQIIEVQKDGNLVATHMRLDDEFPVDSPKYRGRIETSSVITPEGKLVKKLGASGRTTAPRKGF